MAFIVMVWRKFVGKGNLGGVGEVPRPIYHKINQLILKKKEMSLQLIVKVSHFLSLYTLASHMGTDSSPGCSIFNPTPC